MWKVFLTTVISYDLVISSPSNLEHRLTQNVSWCPITCCCCPPSESLQKFKNCISFYIFVHYFYCSTLLLSRHLAFNINLSILQLNVFHFSVLYANFPKAVTQSCLVTFCLKGNFAPEWGGHQQTVKNVERFVLTCQEGRRKLFFFSRHALGFWEVQNRA